jgi:hypothetical protein
MSEVNKPVDKRSRRVVLDFPSPDLPQGNECHLSKGRWMGRGRKRMEWGRGGLGEVGRDERESERQDCEEGGKILAVLLFLGIGGGIVST